MKNNYTYMLINCLQVQELANVMKSIKGYKSIILCCKFEYLSKILSLCIRSYFVLIARNISSDITKNKINIITKENKYIFVVKFFLKTEKY